MTSESAQRFGVVRIGDVFFGFPIEHLIEVFSRGQQVNLPGHSALSRHGVPLRGQMIPLLDFTTLAEISALSDAAQLGIILEDSNRLLAIYIDEIVGLESIESTAFRRFTGGTIEGASVADGLFDQGFAMGERYVTAIDVAQLMHQPSVTTTDRINDGQPSSQERREPMMTFEAGSAILACPAVEVYAAVPKQQILETALTSGPCLGEIRYHDRRIPVVCPSQILGLGNRRDNMVSEVVVMRFSEGRVVGFAVDSINDIQSLPTAKENTLPDWQAEAGLVASVHLSASGRQIFALDVDRLRALKDLSEIADLSKEETQSEEAEAEEASATASISRENDRYLVIDLNDRLAIPLLQVICILDQPAFLTPSASNEPGFRGYFERLGETVALIDLKDRLGQGPIENPDARVLLTSKGGRQVGFLVEKVVAIEVSQWREHQVAGRQTVDGTYVQVGSGETEAVLPYFDILDAYPEIEADVPVPQTNGPMESVMM